MTDKVNKQGAPDLPAQSGIAKVFGTWPGDETEAELLASLEEIRNPTPADTIPPAQDQQAEIDRLREALVRAERKLSAYVGVCKGDKELIDTVLPMARAALAPRKANQKVAAEKAEAEAAGL
jgi:hypothetical protein